MNIILEKPLPWLKSKRDGDRHRLMYENIKYVLHEFKTIETPIKYGEDMKERTPPLNGCYLSYHSIGNCPYVWRIKETPIPFFYSIDKYGYSGWSELSNSSDKYQLHLDKAKSVNIKDANDFCKKIYSWLVLGNFSKYKQTDIKFKLPNNYIFFPLQTLNDPVRQHDRLNFLKVLIHTSNLSKKYKKKLVVKPHPYCRSIKIRFLLKYLRITNPYLLITTASVTQLLDNSDVVITGNSGVGLEALFYSKKVYSFSNSEYDLACNLINDYSDIENVFTGSYKSDVDPKAFLFYYFAEHCFDARNIQNISLVLKKIISVTKERRWDCIE